MFVAIFLWGTVGATVRAGRPHRAHRLHRRRGRHGRARSGPCASRLPRRSSHWSSSPWSGCSSPTPPACRVHDLRPDVGPLRPPARRRAAADRAGSGGALAAWLFPGLGVWLALFVGAALAPTDAALGVPVVTNPVVPSRIRQLITVESGLNDGIATPVVMVAIAGAAAAAGLERCTRAPAAPLVAARASARRSAPPSASRVAGCCAWPAARAGPPRTSPGIAVLALALLAVRRARSSRRQRLRRRVLRRTRVRRLRRPPRHRRSWSSSSRPAGWSRCSSGWPSARSPSRSCSTGSTPMIVLYAVLSLTVVRMLPVALASDRRRARPQHRAVRGLVRSPRAGVPRLRSARPGGPRAGRRRGGRRSSR